MEQQQLLDKIKGSLFGFAIGDSMGATTEFMTAAAIRRTYGVVDDIIGGGWLNLEPGQPTDDTEMMVAVINALVNFSGGLDSFIEECATNFTTWLKTNPKDVGQQCRKAINLINNGKRVGYDPTALGNGSLMRALPCAVVNRIDYNIGQGRLTHNNKECDDAIRLYSDAIGLLLERDPDDHKLLAPNIGKPSGRVTSTLRNALHHAIDSKTFEQAIIGAVNNGGDADTIAALTGGLAGARWGYNKIPHRWLSKLDPETEYVLETFALFAVKHRHKIAK